MKKSIIYLSVAIAVAMLSCSKMEQQTGLKQSLEKSAADINSAISKISASNGYILLTSSKEELNKSDEGYNDSISLESVAGIYDFMPDTVCHNHFFHAYKLFKKTGESEKLIVNLPERLVFHPKYLHFHNVSDTALENNFTIAASEYHFYYNWWHNKDYKLKADISIDSKDAGNLEIAATSNYYRDQSYSSRYTFTEGYNISTERQSGDTSISAFALSKDDDILLKETIISIWKDYHKKEKQYILTIGNIDIKRSKDIDSIQVFLDGVLQKEAAAFIIDSGDSTESICHKRDILLTFDDGTTAKLSEMIDPAKTVLTTLVESLHNMYFAKNIVDYIACNIHFWDRY